MRDLFSLLTKKNEEHSKLISLEIWQISDAVMCWCNLIFKILILIIHSFKKFFWSTFGDKVSVSVSVHMCCTSDAWVQGQLLTVWLWANRLTTLSLGFPLLWNGCNSKHITACGCLRMCDNQLRILEKGTAEYLVHSECSIRSTYYHLLSL